LLSGNDTCCHDPARAFSAHLVFPVKRRPLPDTNEKTMHTQIMPRPGRGGPIRRRSRAVRGLIPAAACPKTPAPFRFKSVVVKGRGRRKKKKHEILHARDRHQSTISQARAVVRCCPTGQSRLKSLTNEGARQLMGGATGVRPSAPPPPQKVWPRRPPVIPTHFPHNDDGPM
jgi:hypothetical protein